MLRNDMSQKASKLLDQAKDKWRDEAALQGLHVPLERRPQGHTTGRLSPEKESWTMARSTPLGGK